ncbi:cell division protein FtsQ/DivIB [Sinomicrobium sp.]
MMRKVIHIVKLFLVMAVLIFLYSFANHRYDKKKLSGIDVVFLDGDNLFITHQTVNKLLIQNADSIPDIPKEKLVLNKLEDILNSNEMIQDAQVYMTVNGQLEAKIKQREPIARVVGKSSYYIDRQGKRMPLSPVHTARVPLVSGNVDEDSIKEVYALVKYIDRDGFLKKNITGIHREASGYTLHLRTDDFAVVLGGVDSLGQKIVNFKAFYQKALKDQLLDKYNKIDLRFNNQVVCTKK